MNGTPGVRGFFLADSKDAAAELTELAAVVRAALASRPVSGTVAAQEKLRELSGRLLPKRVRDTVLSAGRVVVLPDGPLHGIPLEALVPGRKALRETHGFEEQPLLDVAPEIVYAPSGTVYANRRQRRSTGGAEARLGVVGTWSVVALGDPVFDRDRPTEPDYPDHGVAITTVAEATNAANAGLRRGDVILSYDGRQVADFKALVAALQAVSKEVAVGHRGADGPVAVSYWRDGETHETTLATGQMGVRLARVSPAESLRYFAMRSRSEAEKVAEINALDQVRLHGGTLSHLPGTRREAKAIAEVVEAGGGEATLLLGEDATIGALEAAVIGKHIVHTATHGLTGSQERPYDASLALTQPETPTPDDIGFLTLDHMIRRWRGKLESCEMVVLSACDTQRGVNAGDSVMALPWGFMYAGAPSVVASLWKVDDTATALFMQRFYENLLGIRHKRTQAIRHERQDPRTSAHAAPLRQPMSKAEALREAKRWLRSLSASEVRGLLKVEDEAEWAELLNRIRGITDVTKTVKETTPSVLADARPFEHPYYWAAFILIGDPE